jgi:hypothetical protein
VNNNRILDYFAVKKGLLYRHHNLVGNLDKKKISERNPLNHFQFKFGFIFPVVLISKDGATLFYDTRSSQLFELLIKQEDKERMDQFYKLQYV